MRRPLRTRACIAMVGVLGLSAGAGAQSVPDLQQMSIDQLQNLDVTSVTRTSEALGDAPAAVYVVTHDAIVRSGAVTVPEILRLAPNLQVDQISANHYVITARGFSGNIPDQSFANQLLVLIDGRSVYNPIFSGVYWDMQDLVPEDIERIEVISGPGATLWGANAVNGVINITTRRAADTQGGLISLSAGNLEQSASLRYGGTLSDDLAYRVYLREYSGDDTMTATGANPHDHWSKPQGGLRLDWTPSESDRVTVQGDVYSGWENQGAAAEDIRGHNVQLSWDHDLADDSSLQLGAWYDSTSRFDPLGGGQFWLDMYDLNAQHGFALDDRNKITWGGEVRLSRYHIDGTPSLYYAPASRTLALSDAFVQDSLSLSSDLTAVLALKIEDDPYSGVAVLPTGRLSWKFNDRTLFWAAISRAIRSPTPFDRDVQERVGNVIALSGDPDFSSVALTAYELGSRVQFGPQVSFSISGYYNDYTDIRSVELAPGGMALLNLTWGNNLKGNAYGFEAWGDYQPLPWWRLSASFDSLSEHFDFTPAATLESIGIAQIGDDPSSSATLRSSMNLGDDVTVDADFRYVGRLPNPRVPAYAELNANVGWNVSDDVRLSLSGFNLLHAKHQEFPAPDANAVPRGFAVGLQWRI